MQKKLRNTLFCKRKTEKHTIMQKKERSGTQIYLQSKQRCAKQKISNKGRGLNPIYCGFCPTFQAGGCLFRPNNDDDDDNYDAAAD